ncbi:MAG: GNAT family N-acetyltransferase [Azospirillaceae bacterium]
MAARLDIRPAGGADDWAAMRRLFEAYASSLPFDLSFQCFRGEVEGLPGAYAPPAGNGFLAWLEGRPVGCVAVRPIAGHGLCELKRLYLDPSARGLGGGRLLSRAAINWAQAAGYRAMRLDTVDSMVEAVALYRTFGFAEIEAYTHNPMPGARFFERRLV